MDKNIFKKECMGIVNQLFDLAEVPIEKRQAINDKADEYMQEQFLRLFAVSGSKKRRHTRKKHFTPTWCKIINEGCSGCSYYR